MCVSCVKNNQEILCNLSKSPPLRKDIPCRCTWKFAVLLNTPRWTAAVCQFCQRAFFTLVKEPEEKELTAEEKEQLKERRKFCKKQPIKLQRTRDVYGNTYMVTDVVIRNE